MTDKKRIVLFICALALCNIVIVSGLYFGCASFPALVKHIIVQTLHSIGMPLPEMDKYTSKGREEIIRDTTRLLSTFPNNKDALKLRAETLDLNGDYDSSLQDYDRLILLDDKNPAWYLGKAKQLDSLERYEEALQAHNQLIKLQGKNAENLVLRANDYVQMKEKEKALSDLAESEKYPVDAEEKRTSEEGFNIYVDTQYKRAHFYNDLGKQDKYFAYVKSTLENATTLAADKQTLLGERAAIYLQNGNFAAALADYNAQIAADQTLLKDNKYAAPFDLAERANVLLAMGKYKEAKADYKNSLKHLSENLGVNLSSPADSAKCLTLCKRLKDEDAYKRLAPSCLKLALETIADHKHADGDFSVFDISSFVDLAKVLPPEMGKTLAQKVLALPREKDDYDARVDLYFYLKDFAAAQRLTETGTETGLGSSPSTKDCHDYHRWATRELDAGHQKEALRLAQKSVSMAPNEFCGRSVLASVLIARGDIKEAQKEIEASPVQDRRKDDYFMLYQISRAEGDNAAASKDLRMAAALGEARAIDELLNEHSSGQ